MSDLNDTFLSELLGLARGQRAALKEGRLDEALSVLGKRKSMIDRIKVIGRLTENQKITVKEIISIDADISTVVRCGMSDIASQLENIGKGKIYLQSISSKGDEKQAGVSI